MSLFDVIWRAAKAVWDFIVKIVVSVCGYVKNICRYFSDRARRDRLEDPDIIAVAIRKHLDDGSYNVVNCLFDKEDQRVVDPNDMEVITADALDEETMARFGKHDVLVLS